MKAIAIAFVSALVPLGAAAQSTRATQPYPLHDIKLGVTLASFRALERWRDAENQGHQLVCSSDDHPATSVVRPTAELGPAGAIGCGVVMPDPSAEQSYVRAPLQLLGQSGEAAFIFYRGRQDDDLRLTQITLTYDNKVFSSVLNESYRAYGAPTDFNINAVTLFFGARLANSTYTWENRVSSIRMDMFSVSTERMAVMFAHNELFAELTAKLRQMRETQ